MADYDAELRKTEEGFFVIMLSRELEIGRTEVYPTAQDALEAATIRWSDDG